MLKKVACSISSRHINKIKSVFRSLIVIRFINMIDKRLINFSRKLFVCNPFNSFFYYNKNNTNINVVKNGCCINILIFQFLFKNQLQ